MVTLGFADGGVCGVELRVRVTVPLPNILVSRLPLSLSAL